MLCDTSTQCTLDQVLYIYHLQLHPSVLFTMVLFNSSGEKSLPTLNVVAVGSSDPVCIPCTQVKVWVFVYQQR
jgi:hypothetical protein